jgi:hypothetical protein
MDISRTLRDVIALPRNFASRGSALIESLLQESGYFAVHDQVTERAIRDALLRNPEAMSEWLEFSENKRASSGWFLRRAGASEYHVGHFPATENSHGPAAYSEEAAACAAFIKREIEDIRTRSSPS